MAKVRDAIAAAPEDVWTPVPYPRDLKRPARRLNTGRRGRRDAVHSARNPPLKGFAQNQLWHEVVALACELPAWTQMIAMTGPACRWKPKRLRLRIFDAAGRLVPGGRRLRLRLTVTWPRTPEITGRSHPAASPPIRKTIPDRLSELGRRKHKDPWNPARPARQPGSQARPEPEKCPEPMPQASQPVSRKIEAKSAHSRRMHTLKSP